MIRDVTAAFDPSDPFSRSPLPGAGASPWLNGMFRFGVPKPSQREFFGDEADAAVWAESRDRQAAALGRVRFVPGELDNVLAGLGEAVVRPAAGVAYTAEGADEAASSATQALVDRIAAELDPRRVLAS